MIRWLRSSEGFNLVVLAVAVTCLTIGVAAVLPLWSHRVQRDKEEELIFRGLQYAEAIRVFQQRVNRLPVRIEELIEHEPRCIRQLWKNPMREDGAWGLVVATQQRNQNQNQNPARPQQPPQRPPASGGRPVVQEVLAVPGGDHPTPSVPFVGVYSPEPGEAVKTFLGSNEIGEWRFTLDLLRSGPGGNNAAQAPPQGLPVIVNAGRIGRPFPPGVVPPGQGNPQAAPTRRPARRQGEE